MQSRRQTRPSKAATAYVTPVWLLPFWRLVRGPAKGDYAAAWKALPQHLPASAALPPIEEAAAVLDALNLWR